MRVEYLARKSGYSDYCIPDLWAAEGLRPAAYENKALQRRKGSIDLALSIGGLYDLRIGVSADCRSITFDPGKLDSKASVPRATFARRSVAPEVAFDGIDTTFYISPDQHGVIPGVSDEFHQAEL